MEKETKPSSSFMADFLSRAQAVCGGTADAPQLCEASGAGSRGCTGPRCWVHAGDTRAMGPRCRRALGRGKQSAGARGGWPWICHACSSMHVNLSKEDTWSLQSLGVPCPGC